MKDLFENRLDHFKALMKNKTSSLIKLTLDILKISQILMLA